MHILTLHNFPNIGLYAFCTDKFCLVGLDVPKKLHAEMEKYLKVKVHAISIAGTGLVGALLAGHSDMVLVPSITFEHELAKLDKLKIPYTVIDSKITALGNNLVVNRNGCFASSDFTAEQKNAIQTALGVPLKAGMIAEMANVGSLARASERGCLMHPEAKKFELDFVETLLKVRCINGTISGGNPYVSSGIVVNSQGFCASDQSSGIELDEADKIFELVE